MMKKKIKAFLIPQVIMFLIALSVFSFSAMATIPTVFGSLSAEGDAVQAMQYAEIEANIIKLLNYDDVDDDDVLLASNLHTTRADLTAINVPGWEDEVIIGDEETMGDGENKYKIATINIYKKDDTIPRATLEVPLSSQASNSGGEAVGTIVPRLTDTFTSEAEKGCYLYCDGSAFSIATYPKLYAVLRTNVLPDLRNRFLQGNDIGNQVIEAGLPSITGDIFKINAYGHINHGALYQHAPDILRVGQGGGAGLDATTMFFDAERGRKYWHQQIYGNTPTDTIYGNSATVQPPAITVRYYIRAK